MELLYLGAFRHPIVHARIPMHSNAFHCTPMRVVTSPHAHGNTLSCSIHPAMQLSHLLSDVDGRSVLVCLLFFREDNRLPARFFPSSPSHSDHRHHRRRHHYHHIIIISVAIIIIISVIIIITISTKISTKFPRHRIFKYFL